MFVLIVVHKYLWEREVSGSSELPGPSPCLWAYESSTTTERQLFITPISEAATARAHTGSLVNLFLRNLRVCLTAGSLFSILPYNERFTRY